MLTICKFNDHIAEECDAAQLFSRMQKLYHKYRFTIEDHEEMENIDQMLTKILIAINQKCRKYHFTPWSPTLHRNFLLHCYWKIWLSEAKNKKDYSVALTRITDKLQSSPENGKTISANLQDLCCQLRKIHCTAATKRQEHLNTLLDATNETNDTKWQKLILHLKCTEENWWCFQSHCQFKTMQHWQTNQTTNPQPRTTIPMDYHNRPQLDGSESTGILSKPF